MEFKGTKGEWEAKKDSFKVWVESPLWSVSEVFEKETRKEQEANAQLIAAAPELLEALQKNQLMISRIAKIDGGRNIGKSMIMKQFLENEDAINKALGL